MGTMNNENHECETNDNGGDELISTNNNSNHLSNIESSNKVYSNNFLKNDSSNSIIDLDTQCSNDGDNDTQSKIKDGSPPSLHHQQSVDSWNNSVDGTNETSTKTESCHTANNEKEACTNMIDKCDSSGNIMNLKTERIVDFAQYEGDNDVHAKTGEADYLSPPSLLREQSKDSWDNSIDIDIGSDNDDPFEITTESNDLPHHRSHVSSLGFTSATFSNGLFDSIGEYNASAPARMSSITLDDTDDFLNPSSSPSNFAGGEQRRRGSKERRMQQRCGNGPASNKGRFMEKKSSSRRNNGDDDQSLAMSLASFTSACSMTGKSGDGVEVGNLVFVTDEEMPSIVYGDDEIGENTHDHDVEDSSYDYLPSKCTEPSESVASSLPLSSILGTGSFATVRLAWRKSPDASTKNLAPSEAPSLAQIMNGGQQQGSEVIVVDDQKNIPMKQKGELVAVKIIQKSILKQMKTMHKDADNRVTVVTAYDNIEREIATMKKLRHPNLVRFFEVIDSEESDRLYMVLEYVSLGEILSHVECTNRYERTRLKKKVKGLTPGGFFDEEHAALYFVDILHGLAYLHRHHICHRDLKPENILLGADGIAKISDFGVAHMFENERGPAQRASGVPIDDESITDWLSDDENDEDKDEIHDRKSNRHTKLSREDTDSALIMTSMFERGLLNKTEGTWCFWSPEMCSSDFKVFSGYAADLWAAGVCLYIFTTGKLPFFSMIPSELFGLIEKAELQYDALELSTTLKELLAMMLEKDPSSRAGVGDCLKHEFCKKARGQRINELGTEFHESERDIVLTNDELLTAFSVTKISSIFGKVRERFSVNKKHTNMASVIEYDDSTSDEEIEEEKRLSLQMPKPVRSSFFAKNKKKSQTERPTTLPGAQTSSTITDEDVKSSVEVSSNKDMKHLDSMDSETVVRRKHRTPKLKKVSSNADCVIQ